MKRLLHFLNPATTTTDWAAWRHAILVATMYAISTGISLGGIYLLLGK